MKRILSRVVLALTLAFLLAWPSASCSGNSENNSGRRPSAPYIWAQAISISQINLGWYGGERVDGFKIERSLADESNYAQIATVGKNADGFEDTELLAGTTYYYRVRAYNKYGNSDYSDSDWVTTFLDGYGMCVNQTTGFPCLQTRCGKIMDSSSYLTVTGTEVFDCLGVQLTAPATMTVSFAYKASASSGCWNQPYLKVMAGAQVESFSFDCHASGNSSISIAITNGLTINDISYGLSSGDWGSAVCIKKITFEQ